MLKNIYLWGAGYWADYVYEKINKQDCKILGMIDNDVNKQNKEWKHGITVYPSEYLSSVSFDYVVIIPQSYKEIQDQCLNMEIPKEKIIIYWQDEERREIFENRSLYILSLEEKHKHTIEWYERKEANIPYEYGIEKTPKIKSGVELLKYILKTGCSLSRFGDGEFELMLERERPWFQSVDRQLADRLKEIIRKEDTNDFVIAIADDFDSLEKYTQDAADEIRKYLTKDRRMDIMRFIDLEREYYDAYVTRPYYMYKDKNNAIKIFTLFKQIWNNRNVILVEGKDAKTGIGNDLFSSAASIKRILCPQKDAWDKYDEILACVKNNSKAGDLVCISLGPTATVLAYDLAKERIQALDIGQVDNEYDWFIRNANERITIKGKLVAEVSQNCEQGLENPDYYEQIICKIT